MIQTPDWSTKSTLASTSRSAKTSSSSSSATISSPMWGLSGAGGAESQTMTVRLPARIEVMA